jgi:predicted nucleic acid-binding protein
LPRYERVVLDTVTISNFIKAGELDLICELYRDNLYVTEAVIIELGRANIEIEDWVKGGRIRKAEFNYGIGIPREISEALSDGEISCIIYGVETDCAIATDDRKARKAVSDIYGHAKLTGTVGLLVELVQEELITGQYARQLLEEMIEKGFWYKGDTPF